MRLAFFKQDLAAAITALTLVLLASVGSAQSSDSSLPRLVQHDGRYALFVDGAPYILLGAQVNNSSAWPSTLPQVWPALEALHANTVEMPVYWEQFEPEQDRFDYSVVDTLLTQSREHHLHLVLLWFGTWKNGSSHYMPAWMKRSPDFYTHVIGANGRPVDSPSPFAKSALRADISAFSALMGHLKAADPQHTVLMIQVENEPGTWGSVRDYSPAAQKVFDAPVPDALLRALQKQTASPRSNWREVFGDDADEFFHAWAVASYIEQVAAAGKAIYPLPLYVNAALRDPFHPHHPPDYETGGPTDNVFPIWKAMAPSVDLLAPDIYLDNNATMGDQSGAFSYNGGSGEGLLYCDGDLTLNGNFQFRGLVYVEGNLSINSWSWILGGLVVRGKTTLNLHSNGTVLYSKDAINQYIGQYSGSFVTLSWHEVQ